MGRLELLEALQREGREKLAAISARRGAEEERLRAAAARQRALLQSAHAVECERCCNAQRERLLAKARREAALIRLHAEETLALRLYERARHTLPQLYRHSRSDLFAPLAGELPLLPWQTIWTAPGDTAAAAALFPRATIVSDPTLSGGIRAATADNSLTVDNSLETRLKRGWPDLLPRLLAEVREAPP